MAYTNTETERSPGWLPLSSLGTLKPAFNVPSDDQGSHPDDFSVSVNISQFSNEKDSNRYHMQQTCRTWQNNNNNYVEYITRYAVAPYKIKL